MNTQICAQPELGVVHPGKRRQVWAQIPDWDECTQALAATEELLEYTLPQGIISPDLG